MLTINDERRKNMEKLVVGYNIYIESENYIPKLNFSHKRGFAKRAYASEKDCPICKNNESFKMVCSFCNKKGIIKYVNTLSINCFDDKKDKILEYMDYLYSINFPSMIKVSISMIERGAANLNNGKSTVICNVDGDKLRFFDKINNANPVFWFDEALVITTSWDKTIENFSGNVYLVRKDSKSKYHLGYEQIKIFTFRGKNIDIIDKISDKKIDFPKEAVIAAKERAKCYGCKHVHYGVHVLEQ